MPSKTVGLMYESWANLDAALSGLTPEEATGREDGFSSIAWTVAHVTTMVDSWINANFQGLPPNRVIGQPDFRNGGSGESSDWPAISDAVSEVREAARGFLDPMEEPDLDQVVPYAGSIEFLRPTGLRLGYAVTRIAAHHFMHLGEVVTVRSRMGHTVQERPDWGRALV